MQRPPWGLSLGSNEKQRFVLNGSKARGKRSSGFDLVRQKSASHRRTVSSSRHPSVFKRSWPSQRRRSRVSSSFFFRCSPFCQHLRVSKKAFGKKCVKLTNALALRAVEKPFLTVVFVITREQNATVNSGQFSSGLIFWKELLNVQG